MSQRFQPFKNLAVTALLTLCALGSTVQAQPTFGNPSPTSGTSTSDKANAAADAAAYREVEYSNKGRRGPALIVIPGEIKSNNASFTQRFLPNNIADFAELELSNANFPVLERQTRAACRCARCGCPRRAGQWRRAGSASGSRLHHALRLWAAE